jgi:hypothetical protein
MDYPRRGCMSRDFGCCSKSWARIGSLRAARRQRPSSLSTEPVQYGPFVRQGAVYHMSNWPSATRFRPDFGGWDKATLNVGR